MAISIALTSAPDKPQTYAVGGEETPEILVNPTNVGLFGWTSNDLTSVKDLLTYVQAALDASTSASGSATVADAAMRETQAIRDDYISIVARIDQQYIDMVNLANSIAVDTTQIQQYVSQAQNIQVAVNNQYNQIEVWKNQIMQYQMQAVYSVMWKNITTTSHMIEPLLGTIQDFTLRTSTTTMTFKPFSDGANLSRQITLILRQGTGSNRVAWPASIKWNNNRPPVLSYVTGRSDVITLLTNDSGASWFGFHNGSWFNA